VRLAFSKDDARTWSAPTSPHRDGTKTQHGFASLFETPGGGLGLVWLDGRAVDPDPDKGKDNMSLRFASFDRDGKAVNVALVDDRVCDCCPTAVAMTSDGPIAAFRDRSAEEVRDIAVSRLVDSSRGQCAFVDRSRRRLEDRRLPDQRPGDRRARPAVAVA
jgi:hypothetical protein